jgi:hypothetical protein
MTANNAVATAGAVPYTAAACNTARADSQTFASINHGPVSPEDLMKKVITLAAMLVTLGASSAFAQAGLNLNWDECIAGGGSLDKVFACNTNTGAAFVLSCSVIVPSAMPQFSAATAVVDIHVDAVSTTPWWLTDATQCRANSISMSFDPPNNATSCADLWATNPNLQVTAIQQNLHGTNSIRVNGVSALPAGSEISVPLDNAELWVCRVQVNRAATVGACNSGCSSGACIVLNEVKMQQPGGVPDIIVTNAATRQFVTWQGGGATNCPVNTPALNRTWGAVKGLYR